MAKRIATEYVKATFHLSSEGLSKFISFMEEQQLRLQVLILENGSQSLVLEDVVGQEEIRMDFERRYDGYICECSCRITKSTLTNAMRKAVSVFRGHAIAKRIYAQYELIYHYYNGSVHSIVERTSQAEKIIFMKKNTQQKLQQMFDSRTVEYEIRVTQQHVDQLLDQRLNAQASELELIDEQLKQLTQRLFILEA